MYSNFSKKVQFIIHQNFYFDQIMLIYLIKLYFFAILIIKVCVEYLKWMDSHFHFFIFS